MTFKIMSYNIWFDQFLRISRTKSLIKKILIEQPSVICLQEVTPAVQQLLLNDLESLYQYSYPNHLTRRYGCLIMSKYKIENTKTFKFNSNMGRQLDIVNIKIGNEYVIVGNTHFESEFDTLNETKLSQYKYSSKLLNEIFNDNKHISSFMGIFLCSDTNLTEVDKHLYYSVFDSFNDAHVVDQSLNSLSWTYDTSTNIYLLNHSKKIQARLDRILYKTTSMIQTDFSITNGFPNIEISDHYGITSSFVKK